MRIGKGRACALHLTKEYWLGYDSNAGTENPYDFFDDYERHYAWCIGHQKGIQDERKLRRIYRNSRM